MPPQRITHERRATRGDRRALPCPPARTEPQCVQGRCSAGTKQGPSEDQPLSGGGRQEQRRHDVFRCPPCPPSPRPSHRQPEHQPSAPQSWCRWVAPGHRQASRSPSVAGCSAGHRRARVCASDVTMSTCVATAREHPIRLFSAASAGIGTADGYESHAHAYSPGMPRVARRGGDPFGFDLAVVVDAQRDRDTHSSLGLAVGTVEVEL